MSPDENDGTAMQHVLDATWPAVRMRTAGVPTAEARLRLVEALVYVLPARPSRSA